MSDLIEIKNRAPSIVKDEKGRERTDNGRWSVHAMAKYIASHPEKLHTTADLVRVGNERATSGKLEQRRRELTKIVDHMITVLDVPAVLEWGGRKIIAVGRYNPQDDYHQSLMAAEISRRKLRADGSAERLEMLIKLFPARA